MVRPSPTPAALRSNYEPTPASNIVFKDITSVNSGGFYSSLGTSPPGVTFINDVHALTDRRRVTGA